MTAVLTPATAAAAKRAAERRQVEADQARSALSRLAAGGPAFTAAHAEVAALRAKLDALFVAAEADVAAADEVLHRGEHARGECRCKRPPVGPTLSDPTRSACDGDAGLVALAEARGAAERRLAEIDRTLTGFDRLRLRLPLLASGPVNHAGDRLHVALLEERAAWQERYDAADGVLAQTPHERGACACYVRPS